MAARGATVVTVDVDPAMARLTAEAVEGLPNVRVLNLDALAGKHVIHPTILDNVRSALAAGEERRFKVVANLPYHVATPLITNLLVHPELCPTLLVVTIQREMADRLCASPASHAYGAVSVVVQALADVSLVRALPPSVFWPRPKVESAVVAIGPVVRSELPWSTWPDFTSWFAVFSCIGANTCGTSWRRCGRSCGPRPTSIDGSSRKGSAVSFAPRHWRSRNSWRWQTAFASALVSFPRASPARRRNPSDAHDTDED